MTWRRGRREGRQRAERATIATASVKAHALVLVGELRKQVDELKEVLEGLPADEAAEEEERPSAPG